MTEQEQDPPPRVQRGFTDDSDGAAHPASFQSQAAVFHLMQGLLAGEGRTNVAALLEPVPETDLLLLLNYLTDFLGKPLPPRPLRHDQAVQRLFDLIEEVQALPPSTDDRAVTVASAARTKDDAPDLLTATSEYRDRVMLGDSSSVTPRTLRHWRQSAGWVTATGLARLAAEPSNDSPIPPGYADMHIRKMAPQFRAEKVAQLVADGMKPDEADRRVQKEYIAVTAYPGKARHKRGPYEPENPARLEIDLSPQAQTDILERLQAEYRQSRTARQQQGWVSLNQFLLSNADYWPGHSGMSLRGTACQLALSYRQEKLEQAKRDGMSDEAAEGWVQQEHIAVTKGRVVAIDLSPAAQADLLPRLAEHYQQSRHSHHAQGWVAWTTSARAILGHNNTSSIARLVKTLRTDAVRNRVQQGMSTKEAEREVQQTYIATYPGRQHDQHSEQSHASLWQADLSPQAQLDLALMILRRKSLYKTPTQRSP